MTVVDRIAPFLLCLLPMAGLVAAFESAPSQPAGPPIVAPSTVADQPDPVPATDKPDPAARFAARRADARLQTGIECDSAEREIALHEEVQRDPRQCPERFRLRFQDSRITISGRPWDQGDNGIEITVTVERPGTPPLVARYPVWAHSGIWLQVGRLDRSGSHFVLLQDFTGGFHCCMNVRLVILDDEPPGLVPVGSFENPSWLAPYPTDIDGDGRADFILPDDRYFNRFTAPAPDTPLRIWNIYERRLVDVSAAPSFRSFFYHAAQDLRPDCMAQDGTGLLTTCPSYLALAARSGQLELAWREVMEVCRRHRDRLLGDEFATRIEAFLQETGYLPVRPGRRPRNPCDRSAPA